MLPVIIYMDDFKALKELDRNDLTWVAKTYGDSFPKDKEYFMGGLESSLAKSKFAFRYFRENYQRLKMRRDYCIKD